MPSTLSLWGAVNTSSVGDVYKRQVQDCTVYPLENADLMRLLDNADVTLEVFNAAPLYAKAMAAGGWGKMCIRDRA